MLNKARLEKATQFANRNYTITLSHDTLSDGSIMYMAKNPELPGCKAQGRTEVEAVNNLRDARIDYIYFLLEDGLNVPSPNTQIIVTSSDIDMPNRIKMTHTINGTEIYMDEKVIIT